MKWKSIIQEDNSVSFLSGRHGILQKHHCLHGPYRTKAEKDGLYVMLTVEEHRALHDIGTNDKELKRIAQQKWMEHNNTSINEFRARYGVNYL